MYLHESNFTDRNNPRDLFTLQKKTPKEGRGKKEVAHRGGNSGRGKRRRKGRLGGRNGAALERGVGNRN